MPQESTQLRIKDLSLATLLNVEGHAHQYLEQRDETTCLWVFDRTEPVETLTARYMAGEARVEPKKFALELSRVRNEMYRYRDGQRSAANG